MKLFAQPYAQLVRLTKDALRETMAPLRANEMRLKALTRQAELQSQLAEHEQRVVEYGSVYPIDFARFCQAMDDAALTRRRVEQLRLIIDELFPSAPDTAPGTDTLRT